MHTRQVGLRAGDGLPAAARLSPLRSALSGATTRSSGSRAAINSCAWPSRSSPIARACATSKPVCARGPASCITWAFAARVARNTLANANAVRDWRIYADFAQVADRAGRRSTPTSRLGVDLAETVYALDATTIDLCLSMFPWAQFRRPRGRSSCTRCWTCAATFPVPDISDGKMHDVNVLDHLVPEPGAFYVMDRGYVDFARLYRFTRPRRSSSREPKQSRRSSVATRTGRQSTGLLCDQTIVLIGYLLRARAIRAAASHSFLRPRTRATAGVL